MENQSNIDTVVSESIWPKQNFDVDIEGDGKSPTQKQGVDDESHSVGSLLQKRKAVDDIDEDDSDDNETEDDDNETEDDDSETEEEDKETEEEDNETTAEYNSLSLDDYEGSEQQEKDYQEYNRQVVESEGFDMEIFPRYKYGLDFLHKVPVRNGMEFFTKEFKKAAKFAIKQQNESKGANLELVNVIKANRSGYSSLTQLLRLKTGLLEK